MLGAVSTLVVVLVAFGMVVTLAYWTWRTGVPPYPSSRAEREAVVALLQASASPDGILYELGCGWGGLARRLARAFPDHRIEAYEISPIVAWWAKWRARTLPNLTIHHADYLQVTLEPPAAVVCYLMIAANQRLGEKLDKELPSGTPVVSVAFHFPNHQPIETRSPGGWPGGVMLYHWKAESSGSS